MGITRSKVLERARTVWPMEAVPYSQSTIHYPDGYRQDCSGYVCMSWGVPLDLPGSWGGLNTVSMVASGLMYEIRPDDLRPGDAIGRCGPGTAGDSGHVQLFTRWLNDIDSDSRYYCLEQTGGRRGPHETLHDWPDGYKAYRYRDIIDDPVVVTPAPAPAPRVVAPAWPGRLLRKVSPMMHGEDVRAWQGRMRSRGWTIGVDGWYGAESERVCRAFQTEKRLGVDGIVGPNTWRAAWEAPIT
jgi:hypothetical protein